MAEVAAAAAAMVLDCATEILLDHGVRGTAWEGIKKAWRLFKWRFTAKATEIDWTILYVYSVEYKSSFYFAP